MTPLPFLVALTAGAALTFAGLWCHHNLGRLADRMAGRGEPVRVCPNRRRATANLGRGHCRRLEPAGPVPDLFDYETDEPGDGA